MKPPLHLPLLLALGLSACVSTSLPQFVIPETPGEFDATLSAAAITGLHLNCIYALDNTLVATCALHSGFSLYGELGFGAVTRNRKNLLLASFGHGRFDILPDVIYGGSYGVSDYYGVFYKASISWNHRLKRRNQFSQRVSLYKGIDSGDCIHICNRFFNRHFTGPVCYEFAFSTFGGKRSHFVFSFGGVLYAQIEKLNASDTVLGPPVLFFSIGGNISTRKRR